MAQFQIPFPAPLAGRRLAVFHHAGGSSLSFSRLARALAPAVEVWLAEMPGRASRHLEPPGEGIVSLGQAYALDLAKDSRPLEIYGHSMGGLIAFECTRALEKINFSLQRLVISCVRAPASLHGPPELRGLDLSQWTDSLLLSVLGRYGDLPAALLSSAGQEYFLPLLRQDFALVRGYQPSGKTVNTSLLALSGESDLTVPGAEVELWRDAAAGSFAFCEKEGGHFFVLDKPKILQEIFGR